MIETDRLIDPGAAGSDEAQDRAVRPKSLAEYIGQGAVREQMEIFCPPPAVAVSPWTTP
jgi:Holliday junction DNA helicase RuvB